MAKKRMKASDVARETKWFFERKKVTFEEAFPEIKEITVEIAELKDPTDPEPRQWTYKDGRIPPYFKCNNEFCNNGGVHLEGILREMVDKKETDFDDRVLCQGYEGSRKGSIKRGPCDHSFRIKIHIIYRDVESTP